MRLYTLVMVAVMAVAPALAQIPQPKEDPNFCPTAVQVLVDQRNKAQNDVAQIQTQATLLTQKVADLQKQLDALQPKKK